MSRIVTVGAAQMGPVQRADSREAVVERLLALLRDGHEAGCDLVVCPARALTTCFPRVHTTEQAQIDARLETEMPSPASEPLFEEARALGVGFSLGYAELTPDGHHYNSQILVERDGSAVAVFHKVHIPGHEENEPWRPFQHLERF